MNSSLDYALAGARASELQRHGHVGHNGHDENHRSLSNRIRRRREAARRARARRSSPKRLRAA
jgi:hypothetical protein